MWGSIGMSAGRRDVQQGFRYVCMKVNLVYVRVKWSECIMVWVNAIVYVSVKQSV